MKIINVKLQENSYPVYIGNGIFDELVQLVELKNLYKNLFIVLDKNVEKHFGTMIRHCFDAYDGKKYFYSFHAVEKSKSLEELKKIYSALIEQKFGRDTLIIAIGGGITGDLAGFATATFMRGVQVIHVPTTLIGCVDSAIGGKTAVNFNYYKNIIGSFYQPKFVLCDTRFLTTLPAAEMACGLGEIIKYAFTASKEYYNLVDKNLIAILSHDEKILEEIISHSINYKVAVVSQDEKELGLRKVLNFGHTFAHAFEKELKHKIKHGEAVIMGITCALFLSYKMKLLSRNKLAEFLRLPSKIKLGKSLKTINHERVYQHMSADKKNIDSEINFVLIRDIGELVLDVHANKLDVIAAINSSIKLLAEHTSIL